MPSNSNVTQHGHSRSEPYWRVKDVLPYGYAVENPEGTEFSDWDSWHKPTFDEAQAVADRLNEAGYRGHGAREELA